MAISVSPRGVGDRLKEARARRGVDLQEASRVTRIRPRFLEALEEEAPPRTFRAPVYARAFLREYARYLGLDPEPLVDEYRAAYGDRDPAPTPLPGQPPPARRITVGAVALALLTVAAIAALAVVTLRDLPVPVAERPGTSSTSEEPAPRVVPPTGTEPAAERVRLRVRLVDGPSWLLVMVDGDVVARGRRRQGFDRVFVAERRIRLHVDDGGAARLRLNGERLGAPAPSRVSYRARFVLRDGEVRAIRTS